MSFKYKNLKLKILRRWAAYTVVKPYIKYEYFIRLLKYMIKTKNISKQTRVLAVFNLTMLQFYIPQSYHKNTCLLTGQHRGVNVRFKLHRGSLRQQANTLFIPGLTASSW